MFFFSLCSLASILQKRSLADAKLDEIKLKVNVLSAFTAKKIEEAEEKVAETIERSTEEL